LKLVSKWNGLVVLLRSNLVFWVIGNKLKWNLLHTNQILLQVIRINNLFELKTTIFYCISVKYHINFCIWSVLFVEETNLSLAVSNWLISSHKCVVFNSNKLFTWITCIKIWFVCCRFHINLFPITQNTKLLRSKTISPFHRHSNSGVVKFLATHEN
jgi:hypothetical protein